MSGDAMTDSAGTTWPPITTIVCVALRAPVVKIVKRKSPPAGSNGPGCRVPLLRIIPSPVPSPGFVKTPGAVRRVGTVQRD